MKHLHERIVTMQQSIIRRIQESTLIRRAGGVARREVGVCTHERRLTGCNSRCAVGTLREHGPGFFGSDTEY